MFVLIVDIKVKPGREQAAEKVFSGAVPGPPSCPAGICQRAVPAPAGGRGSCSDHRLREPDACSRNGLPPICTPRSGRRWRRNFDGFQRAHVHRHLIQTGLPIMKTRRIAALTLDVFAGRHAARHRRYHVGKKIAFSNNYAGNSWRQAMLKSYGLVAKKAVADQDRRGGGCFHHAPIKRRAHPGGAGAEPDPAGL